MTERGIGHEPVSDGFSGPVVVTGASGFLGSRLAERLVRDGATVVGLSRSLRESDRPRMSWRRIDVTDWDAVDRLVEEWRPAVIYHLAGAVSGGAELALVRETFESLLQSTVCLLRAAAAAASRPRLVLAGSLTEPPATRGATEPGSPYVAAKCAATVYGGMFHRAFGTPVVSARMGFGYGPGQPPHRVIPYVIESLLAGKTPELSTGRLEADWVYVDDLVEGLCAIGTAPDLEGETVDLGSGSLTAVRDVVRRIADLIGTGPEPRFGARPDRPAETFFPADVVRTERQLGWRATTALDDGLAATIRWHRERRRGGVSRPSSGGREER